MIRILFLTGVFLFFTSAAIGEYYQYTDDSGAIRYTDDMTQIPESQRKGAATYESEVSSGGDIESGYAYSDEVPDDSGPDDVDIPEAYAAPAGETFETRATELNNLQAKLNNTRRNLEKEQAELQAQVPGKDATGKEKIDYRMKVDHLNAKIEHYGKDLKAFEAKVESFNQRNHRNQRK